MTKKPVIHPVDFGFAKGTAYELPHGLSWTLIDHTEITGFPRKSIEQLEQIGYEVIFNKSPEKFILRAQKGSRPLSIFYEGGYMLLAGDNKLRDSIFDIGQPYEPEFFWEPTGKANQDDRWARMILRNEEGLPIDLADIGELIDANFLRVHAPLQTQEKDGNFAETYVARIDGDTFALATGKVLMHVTGPCKTVHTLCNLVHSLTGHQATVLGGPEQQYLF